MPPWRKSTRSGNNTRHDTGATMTNATHIAMPSGIANGSRAVAPLRDDQRRRQQHDRNQAARVQQRAQRAADDGRLGRARGLAHREGLSDWLHHARLDGSGHAGARRFGVAARPFAEIGGRRRPRGCFLKGRRPLGPTSRSRRDHHGRQWPLGGGPRRLAARRAPPGGRGGAPDRARRARARHPVPDAVCVLGAELGAARGRGRGADAAPASGSCTRSAPSWRRAASG